MNFIKNTAVVCCFLTITSVSCQIVDHVCSGVKVENAGKSGSIKVRGNCSLTLSLTNTSDTISLSGIKKPAGDSCTRIGTNISVHFKNYCADESASGTIIELNGARNLLIIAYYPIHFTLHYYHGELYSELPWNSSLFEVIGDDDER